MLFVCRRRWDGAIQCRMHFLKCGTVNAISIMHYQVAPRNDSRTFRKWWRFLFANDNEHLKCKSLKIAQTTDKRHFYDLLLDAFEQWIGGTRFLYCVRWIFFPPLLMTLFSAFAQLNDSLMRTTKDGIEQLKRRVECIAYMEESNNGMNYNVVFSRNIVRHVLEQLMLLHYPIRSVQWNAWLSQQWGTLPSHCSTNELFRCNGKEGKGEKVFFEWTVMFRNI